tara:strand:+ start:249 stop:848 length:600 start_codon:yes stop_codon:yes gene_type:complete
MNVLDTPLPGVLVIEPRVFSDDRGFFLETYQRLRYAQSGIAADFVQDNWSHSQHATLRGLHYQLTRPQAKLVSVVSGCVFDVAVDLRRHSPTFGQWFGTTLSSENRRQLFVPVGCAHGFLVTSQAADFQYKCTDIYHPDGERTLLWNDPEIGIDWPLEQLSPPDREPVISDKDRHGTPLADADCFDDTVRGDTPGSADA